MCLSSSGGPGSGKALQCERLEERFGLRRVALGDLLCSELQSNSDRGRHLRDVLERGEQLPEVSVELQSEITQIIANFLLVYLTLNLKQCQTWATK